MNKQEVISLLESLEFGEWTDSYDMLCMLREKFGRDETNKLFAYADGASKNCLIFRQENFVLKWVCGSRYNEAMEEVTMYQKAVSANLAQFFPRTEFLIKLNGIDFVMQEKIDCSVYNLPMDMRQKYERISRTASRRKCGKMEKEFQRVQGYKRDLDYLWASMALVLYGKKACKALSKFIHENNINDLHDSNVGYKNNRPIILDFSGYHR